MRDIPVDLSGFKLMVTEPPVPKMREGKNGEMEVVTGRDGATQFVVSLFAKRRPVEGQRPSKGEEIRVTLTVDPGDCDEGSYVQLIGATVSPYSFQNNDGQTVSGISFAANSLAPAN